MTDDLARLVQIAAMHFSRGMISPDVEAQLLKVAPGAEPDDITEALAAGNQAVAIAEALNTGDTGAAAAYLDLYRDDELRGWRVLYRVRTGPGPDDWAGGARTLPPGVGTGQIRAFAEEDAAAVLGRVKEHDSLPGGGLPDVIGIDAPAGAAGRVEIVYVAPM